MKLGETTRLICATHGIPSASVFQWSQGDKHLPEETDDVIDWIASSEDEVEVVLKCEASNEFGSTFVNFFITVRGETSFIIRNLFVGILN